MARKKIPQKIQCEVLERSKRRCCICFAICHDHAVKKGQIAHLDKSRDNNALGNLAFLCLEHHDELDSTTSQSKNWKLEEVKGHREELYDAIPAILSGEFSETTHGKATTRISTGPCGLTNAQSFIVTVIATGQGPVNVKKVIIRFLRESSKPYEIKMMPVGEHIDEQMPLLEPEQDRDYWRPFSHVDIPDDWSEAHIVAIDVHGEEHVLDGEDVIGAIRDRIESGIPVGTSHHSRDPRPQRMIDDYNPLADNNDYDPLARI